MKFRIDQIDANPFRHIDRYPIREDKITALRESISTTGFWDNLVGRQVGDRVQIAYGHHRREALRREFPGEHEVALIVRDLPDEQMLRIMARENLDEWGTSAGVEHETVRAVIEAYAARKIDLPSPGDRANASQLRYAPSFQTGDAHGARRAHPYTAQAVADFLGWTLANGRPQDKVMNALAALAFIEEGVLSEADFDGMSTKQAEAIIEQARRARALAEQQAKLQRQEAERQAKAAEAARQAQARAERDRAAAAERAERARDEAARRRAQEQAEAARREAAIAAKEQREAQRRAETAAAKEQAFRTEGRQAARTVGQDVGRAMRAGEGYRNAAEIAEKSRPQRDAPPLDIDVHAQRIGARVHELLDPEYHKLARSLDELIRFRAHLSPAAVQGLARELSALAARASSARDRLTHQQDLIPDSSPDFAVLDADVVTAPTAKEITQ